MTLDGDSQIGLPHAFAIVAHGNESPPPSIGENVNTRGAGVECVFDQLLDDARRTLDHLAGGDAIDDRLGELTDGHLAIRDLPDS